MSIDVSVKQKGFIKKELPLEAILGSKLSYGAHDGLRVTPGEMGNGEFVAFMPELLARGISVIWSEGEKKQVDLRLLNPTLPEEVHELFEIVRRISKVWKCTLEVDGNPSTLEEFLASESNHVEFNDNSVNMLFNNIVSGETETLTLYSAKWPLTVGIDDAKRFINDHSAFYAWLQEKQSVDAYYAKAQYYQDEDKHIQGIFVLTEETRSIFPLAPSVPVFARDPETGEAWSCNDYLVTLFSYSANEAIGTIPYERFLKLIEERAVPYDADTVIFEGLTLAEMKEAIE